MLFFYQKKLSVSPGMIDSVGKGRGYDFAEAVSWFAERADYVLFFFDGEKPGTTGGLFGVSCTLFVLLSYAIYRGFASVY